MAEAVPYICIAPVPDSSADSATSGAPDDDKSFMREDCDQLHKGIQAICFVTDACIFSNIFVSFSHPANDNEIL